MGVGVGVLDEIKAISAPAGIGIGLGLSLAISGILMFLFITSQIIFCHGTD